MATAVSLPSSRLYRTKGRHRKPTSQHIVLIRRTLAAGALTAILAALVVLTGLTVTWPTKASMIMAVPRLSPPPAPMAPAAPARAPVTPFAADDRGFVNSTARCGGTQTALAIGRTQRSLVVICADQNGQYEYRGVRLSDQAVLNTFAETTPTRGFLARNDNVNYAVTPTELLVTADDVVIKQEPMVEYRGPSTVG